MPDAKAVAVITGRCYCGATTFQATEPPVAVAYCHCTDCRRVTGAPVAAFAAFRTTKLTFSPHAGRRVSITPGVTRTFCETCGSPLSGRYAYLPDTVYVALGLIDQAHALPPERHAHEANRLVWLHIEDELARHPGSARSELDR